MLSCPSYCNPGFYGEPLLCRFPATIVTVAR
jgi:hypothetical protein